MQKSVKDESTRAVGFLILFALPFAGVGIFATYLVFSTVWAWVEVQDWQERPAHILSVDLISQPSDDSTTYSVETLYEYRFRGERFTSDRVTLTSGSDNVGSFHHDVHRELSRHQQSGSLFRCYVDPEDPTRAILYREIRLGLLGLKAIFALVFGGAGFGLIGLALRGKKKVKAQKDLKQLYPEEPWRWREEWAEGRVPASSKANMIGTSVFAIFWNLISLPLLFIVPEEIRGGNLLASIGLLFPAVGAGMALWALRLFIQWRKFGHSTFEMSEVPGVTGGLLQGQILTGTHIQPQEDIRLTLNCVERRTTGSGKNRSTSETILWQDTQLIRREALDYRSRGCAIPVRFGIPYHAPPSDQSAGGRILWRLETAVPVHGVDYAAQFEVPVFTTEQSAEDFETDLVSQHEGQVPVDRESQLREAGIVTETLPEGKRFLFQPARHVGAATGLTLFFSIWSGAILLMHHLGAPLLFPIVFGLFDLLILWGVLELWFSSRRVEVARQGLSFSGSLLVLGRRRTVSAEEITGFKVIRGMQAGNHLYYRIQMSVLSGDRYIVASQLDSLDLAEHLIREFDKELKAAG